MFGITDHAKGIAAVSTKPLRIRRTTRPQRLILMGTGPFAVPAFEALREAGHEIALVVSRPAVVVKSRTGPPPSPVREFAGRYGYPIFDPASINTPEAIARLLSQRASLLVVCDYGQILSSDALASTPLGGINLHGSLLPAYRGAAPVQWAVLNGDRIAGVSIIHMTPRLDGGPVLASAEIPIDATDTAGTLEAKLAKLGVEPTLSSVELLAQWDRTSSIGVPQEPSRVSRAPRLSKALGQIDWRRSAVEIDRHVRGMQPWPGAYTDLRISPERPPLRIAVRAVTILDLVPPPTSTPGTLIEEGSLSIVTGPAESPGVIRIDRLQAAGRSEVSGEDFIRGHRIGPGVQFGSVEGT
ncbi:MAG: methionyl-tRNA formyltransferase [Planctomycetaceae bacterium]